MFITKKINKDTVAVLNDYPVSINIRKSGRLYYGTEKPICKICDDKLIINEDVANEFGIIIERRR